MLDQPTCPRVTQQGGGALEYCHLTNLHKIWSPWQVVARLLVFIWSLFGSKAEVGGVEQTVLTPSRSCSQKL